jgi:hypothetical protein
MYEYAGLAAAAGAGWKAFSAAFDKIGSAVASAKYERAKKRAFREVLKGDGCDWELVAECVDAGKKRGDNDAIATRLRDLHHNYGSGGSSGTGYARKAKKLGTVKRGTRKLAARKRVRKLTAKKGVRKPTAKKGIRRASVKKGFRRSTAKKVAARRRLK